jgi:hypothetical protein
VSGASISRFFIAGPCVKLRGEKRSVMQRSLC